MNHTSNNPMNCTNRFRELVVGLTISSVIIQLTLTGIDGAYAQSMSAMKNNTAQQHAEHTIDNLVISEHIPLTGQLVRGDYILLMDFTPFVTSIEGHSHIALKVPCDVNGTPKVRL